MNGGISPKNIEIFCGTGGVGKTTLATSRALALAKEERKVLLITIDPAKRLKQILGLENNEDEAGEIHTIDTSLFKSPKKSFDALLMSPGATLKRMSERNSESKTSSPSLINNPIISILTRPYGGMNEIMSIVEVQHHLSAQKYDTIILDTPPGKHFIDFLHSSEKIKQFFDKSFIDIFKIMGKNSPQKSSPSLTSLLVKSGVKKLLHYLEKVTGAQFVTDFIDAMGELYSTRQEFLKSLEFQQSLKYEKISNWFLVTSVEQFKYEEAQELQQEAQKFMHNDSYLIVNKSLTPHLESWPSSSEEDPLLKLRDSIKRRESKIKKMAHSGYRDKFFFPEVLKEDPQAHVQILAKNWPKKSL